jgi:hypothetical protein
MPRPPRLHGPGGHYHVILRGNHREPLFDSPADREALGDIVAKAIERFDARVHAFCWESSSDRTLYRVRCTALAEPDLERYPIRLPVEEIRSVHKACTMRGRGSQVFNHDA